MFSRRTDMGQQLQDTGPQNSYVDHRHTFCTGQCISSNVANFLVLFDINIDDLNILKGLIQLVRLDVLNRMDDLQA